MRRLAAFGLFLASASPLPGQDTLSLTASEAVERARVAHPQVQLATTERRLRQADLHASRATFLPSVTSEWSLIRTDDPVAVFGSKLRQARFGEADFAIAALNHPRPVSNAALVVSVEQPILAPQGWLGRQAARQGIAAAELVENRTRQVAAFDALRSYFAALAAGAAVAVYDTSLAAARQTLSQVRSLRREGVVTAVDEQLALSRVSELEAGRAGAGAGLARATTQLLVAMGEPPDRPLRLVDDLEQPPPALGTSTRSDLAALRVAIAAEDANLARIRAQWLPTLGAFGSLAWNQGNFGALAGPRHWTAGLAVRWSPFRGGADWAALDRARTGREQARIQLAAAERGAAAEVLAAQADIDASALSLAAAERALQSAEEASRIAAARYSGGVATISELLGVRAAEASQRLARLEALYRVRVARASLALAKGGDPQ